uniref:Sperm-activating peptide (Ser-3, Gly-5 SAP-I) n=2 Tax=Echinacea TaxID=7674 RepID=Q7M3T7_TRIGR|nr:sperm-activating peptide I (3-Ser,5-Gly) [Tripneustes gratilla]
GFSLGGGGVG